MSECVRCCRPIVSLLILLLPCGVFASVETFRGCVCVCVCVCLRVCVCVCASQVVNYAERKGMSVEEAEKWLQPTLGYDCE